MRLWWLKREADGERRYFHRMMNPTLLSERRS